MMSYPPSENGPDPGSSPDFADLDKAQQAWKTGQQYARENPIPLVLLALVLGALLGALLNRRERKQKDAAQVAKEWLQAAYEQLAEKLPQLAEKLPQPRKTYYILVPGSIPGPSSASRKETKMVVIYEL